MKKSKLFYNPETEEQWLNEMSRSGWKLVAFKSGSYKFEPSQEQYQYKVELTSGTWRGKKNQDFLAFLESLGLDVVGSSFHKAIIRRPEQDKPFEIYTDTASQLKQYRHALYPFLVCFIVYLVLALAFLMILLTQGLSPSRPAFYIILGGFLYLLVWMVVISIPVIQLINQLKSLKQD